MNRFRSLLCFTLLLAGLMMASQAGALPPCETYCSCAVPCFVTACDGGGGLVQDCSEWGICATSCYCGGECLQAGDPPSKLAAAVASPSFAKTGACSAPSQADILRAAIFR